MKAAWVLVLGLACSAAWADECDNPTGFMKKVCESKKGSTGDALSAGIGDGPPSEVLPGAVDATGFEKLSKLSRTDTGAFVLTAGLYEADVEAFSLDGNPAVILTSGFWPVPIRGNRASMIGNLLKNAELHPDLSHADIQDLLTGIAGGISLPDVSEAAQQVAVTLLSKEEVEELGGLSKHSESGGGGKKALDVLMKMAQNNPTVQHMKNKATQDGLPDLSQIGQGDKKIPAKPVVKPRTLGGGEGIAQGSWVKMPQGFYVRYLAAIPGRVKLQVAVPGGTARTEFDPTQFLAVSGGFGGTRLGIALRATQ
jgi:hypothetical protein